MSYTSAEDTFTAHRIGRIHQPVVNLLVYLLFMHPMALRGQAYWSQKKQYNYTRTSACCQG